MPFPPSFLSFFPPIDLLLFFRHLTKNAAAADDGDDDDEFRRPNTKPDAATLVAPLVRRRGECEGQGEGIASFSSVPCKVLREARDVPMKVVMSLPFGI